MDIIEQNKALFKISVVLIFSFFSLIVHASDYYITTSDVNLRSGAGKSHKPIAVIKKGDTVKLLGNSGSYWAKIQYQNKVGYSAKQYLLQIEIPQKLEEPEEVKESLEENSVSFSTFFIFMIIILVSAIILKKIGEVHRNKSVASIISFFFGVFGFQKFYLGKTSQGILSILFSWTFIPIIVGIIDFIRLEIMADTKFNDKYNKSKKSAPQAQKVYSIQKMDDGQKTDKTVNQRTTMKLPTSTYYSKQQYKDDSIIDINTENLDLKIEKHSDSEENKLAPPFWPNLYIYSYDAIKNATKAQKEFYFYLKKEVLNDNYVDIQDHTNYAFVLYFDFLNEYQDHKDIKLLDKQFKLLGEICPKTKIYSISSLQKELRKRTDTYSIEKLKDLEDPSYQFEHGYSDFNPDLYKLGTEYKEKLGLSNQETRWLNKFYNPSNVFTSIEGCCIAIIKQYIIILKELDKLLKKNGTTLVKEVTYFKNKLRAIYENRSSEWEYYNGSYFGNQAESDIYLTIFKRVENSVRDSFGHTRKVSGDFPYVSKALTDEFENKIGSILQELIGEYQYRTDNPDIETQIVLNSHNVNRWKIDFTVLKDNFKKEEVEKFIDGIVVLEETNQKNPNIENIFFEASKFIAKYDKVQALKYYAKYIYYDLKSKKFDNKELTKTVQKSLFKTDEQINDFKEIISELIKTSDIHTALDRISKIYIPKRKKIKLDRSEIQEVEQKHEGTVELLNEYLEDDESKEITVSNNENYSEEDSEVTIIHSSDNNSIFISEVQIGQVQEELIKKIISNSYRINQSEVDKYATENGMFKNQLIDSINEACEECLDGEALIEEDEEDYIIEESYYKEIVK
ncbi:tellurite resistance TerB C-terminal domain-containing protein [Sinomicrobium oceani]|uniref:tellurite resistance TerB C-terminal domain-containing protein n=1 Tax=Sinomicrobium oceani TaxID=1150368 RepID=UPI00227B9B34|nr:tellurite resistance TerB C-terminal domain-containing protein [Sinomicrobium oceani]